MNSIKQLEKIIIHSKNIKNSSFSKQLQTTYYFGKFLSNFNYTSLSHAETQVICSTALNYTKSLKDQEPSLKKEPYLSRVFKNAKQDIAIYTFIQGLSVEDKQFFWEILDFKDQFLDADHKTVSKDFFQFEANHLILQELYFCSLKYGRDMHQTKEFTDCVDWGSVVRWRLFYYSKFPETLLLIKRLNNKEYQKMNSFFCLPQLFQNIPNPTLLNIFEEINSK